mmetsp:Transcript_21339/g.63739  ORF Transcript_21339/g.63739 Transcript_21339/m.63739 type:complete len:222 (+) Transcript_21339:30-695(+)
MTTAHRPTWTAAREHGNEFGVYSSGGVRSAMAHARDVPNQLKMKYRTGHQLEGIADATPEDYAARLDAAERSSGAPQGQLLLAADARVARAPDQLRDVAVAPGALDAYDDRDASDGEGSDSDSDSDDDDDGAALRAELEKIRAERDAERRREEDEAAAAKAAAATNPLLDPAPSGAVKRRWNDDVVFRHQARGAAEKKGRTFVNDTIRNDFHKRFLAKYIQ